MQTVYTISYISACITYCCVSTKHTLCPQTKVQSSLRRQYSTNRLQKSKNYLHTVQLQCCTEHLPSQCAVLCFPFTPPPPGLRKAPHSYAAADAWGKHSPICQRLLKTVGVFLTPSRGSDSLFWREPALPLWPGGTIPEAGSAHRGSQPGLRRSAPGQPRAGQEPRPGGAGGAVFRRQAGAALVDMV